MAAKTNKKGATLVIGSKNITKMQIKSSEGEDLDTLSKSQIRDVTITAKLRSSEIVLHQSSTSAASEQMLATEDSAHESQQSPKRFNLRERK